MGLSCWRIIATSSIWHKKELPSEAIQKIKGAIDDVLGKKLPGQYTLDKEEFENLSNGFKQSHTIPEEISDGLIEVFKYYTKQRSEKNINN